MATILNVTWDYSPDNSVEAPDETGRHIGRVWSTGGAAYTYLYTYYCLQNWFEQKGDANGETICWIEYNAHLDWTLDADWTFTFEANAEPDDSSPSPVRIQFGQGTDVIQQTARWPYWIISLERNAANAATFAMNYRETSPSDPYSLAAAFTWTPDTDWRFSVAYTAETGAFTLRADTVAAWDTQGYGTVRAQGPLLFEGTGPGELADFAGNPNDTFLACISEGSIYQSVWINSFTLEADSTSDCNARVQAIIDQTRQLFNDGGGGFISDSEIISWAGSAYDALASAGYFKKEAYLSVVAGTTDYDLLAFDEDLVRLYEITDVQEKYRKGTTSLQNYSQLQAFQKDISLLRNTMAWFVNGTTLMVAPSPNASSTDRYKLYYSYLPTALSCSAAPLTPKAFDDLYVYSALEKAFEKDRHAPGAMAKVGEYRALKDQEIKKVARSSSQGRKALRPYI